MEALTDGVVAIVITLLVLELGVAAGAEEDLLQAILDEWPSYLAYFISFFTVGAFWLRHQAMTEAMSEVDSAFIRLNLVAIFFVSVLPFPTRLAAEFLQSEDAERVAVVFYGTILFLAALSFVAVWRYASKNRRLLKPEISDDEARELDGYLTPSLVAYLVAILAGLAVPFLAFVFYLLIAVLIALPVGTLRAARRAV